MKAKEIIIKHVFSSFLGGRRWSVVKRPTGNLVAAEITGYSVFLLYPCPLFCCVLVKVPMAQT